MKNKKMKKEGVRFFAVGNEDLGAEAGKFAICPHCGQEHLITYGTVKKDDGKRVKSKLLGFVKCGKNTYLVTVNNRMI